MRLKDDKNRKIKENKNLYHQGHRAWEALENEGLIRIPGASLEARAGQMNHNAGHALWYFSMTAYALIQGRRNRATARATERVLAHLAYLKEFVSEEDVRVEFATHRLFRRLIDDFPETDRDWLQFLIQYWDVIRDLSEAFVQGKNCFPVEDLMKLKDIRAGRYLFRMWWWRAHVLKRVKRVRIALHLILVRAGCAA